MENSFIYVPIHDFSRLISPESCQTYDIGHCCCIHISKNFLPLILQKTSFIYTRFFHPYSECSTSYHSVNRKNYYQTNVIIIKSRLLLAYRILTRTRRMGGYRFHLTYFYLTEHFGSYYFVRQLNLSSYFCRFFFYFFYFLKKLFHCRMAKHYVRFNFFFITYGNLVVISLSDNIIFCSTFFELMCQYYMLDNFTYQ